MVLVDREVQRLYSPYWIEGADSVQELPEAWSQATFRYPVALGGVDPLTLNIVIRWLEEHEMLAWIRFTAGYGVRVLLSDRKEAALFKLKWG